MSADSRNSSAADSSESLILLHGFTGSPAGFDELSSQLATVPTVTVPLPGHDQEFPIRVGESFSALVDRLLERLPGSARSPRSALGYSMGARLLLAAAVRAPERFRRLYLIAARVGLSDPLARERRWALERGWVERLRRDGIESFVEFWERLPSLQSQQSVPLARQAGRRAIRLGHDPEQLACCLESAGLAPMNCFLEDLAGLPVPLTLVCGAADAPFIEAARAIEARVPEAALLTIPATGHDPIFEDPAGMARRIMEWWKR